MGTRTPRQRRAARRRAIRSRYPVGMFIVIKQSVQNRAQALYFGEWIIYGYSGQSLMIRRYGFSTGYRVRPSELGYPNVRVARPLVMFEPKNMFA